MLNHLDQVSECTGDGVVLERHRVVATPLFIAFISKRHHFGECR